MSDIPITDEALDALIMMRMAGRSNASASQSTQQLMQHVQRLQTATAVSPSGSRSTATGSTDPVGQSGLQPLRLEVGRVPTMPAAITSIARLQGNGTPQTRVMSPNNPTNYGLRAHVCTTCLHFVDGPAAMCSSCNGDVHPQCVTLYMHNFFCHPCFS